MVNGVWIPIIIFSSVPVMVIGFPIARAFARRIEQQPDKPQVSPEVTARLERMEQALDTIAIEVERISEGQRFTTKLLSDRTNSASSSPKTAERAP